MAGVECTRCASIQWIDYIPVWQEINTQQVRTSDRIFSRGAMDRLERLRRVRGDTGQSRSSRIDVIAPGRNRALYVSGEIYRVIAGTRDSSSSRYVKLIARETHCFELTKRKINYRSIFKKADFLMWHRFNRKVWQESLNLKKNQLSVHP